MTAVSTHRPSRRRLIGGATAAVGALLCLAATAAQAGSIGDIRARGTLVVGAKADYRPFG